MSVASAHSIVTIDHLFKHPEYTRLVATWIYDEFWRDKPGYSVDFFECLLRDASHPDTVPLSFLALVNGSPAGTANLIENDDRKRLHLRPWLAAVLVVPEYRHRQIGSMLVRRVVDEARRLGFSELFLGTDIPEFYARLGAMVHEQVTEIFSIMRIET